MRRSGSSKTVITGGVTSLTIIVKLSETVFGCPDAFGPSSLAVQTHRRGRELSVEVEKLGHVNAFLETMFEAMDPVANRLELEKPTDVRVVDVLDYVATNLSNGYRGQPDVEATLRTILGQAYSGLDSRERSAAAATQASSGTTPSVDSTSSPKT